MRSKALISMTAVSLPILIAPALVSGKPHAAAKEEAKKDAVVAAMPPAVGAAAGVSVAQWLAGSSAVSLPFADVIQAWTGKTVLPVDAANPADAAILARIGSALDALLPRMNRLDSSAHTAAATNDPGSIAACFENELSAVLLPPRTATLSVVTGTHGYPAFFVTDPANGKTYALAVTVYATGGKPDSNAITIQPGSPAPQLGADGCCLLVGIEHNKKSGHEIAFMNWELLDLAKLKVRFVPVFQATQEEALQPAAVLTDGRKGRD